MEILVIINIVLVITNIVFIYFYFSMDRQNKKAIIKTSFIGYDKWVEEQNDKQEVLEYNPFYLNVRNISKNQINNLKLNIKFFYNGDIIKEKEEKLDYLNPYEKVTFNIIPFNFLKEKFKDKIKELEIKKGETLIIVKSPTEKLEFEAEFIFKWNYFFKQKDSYKLTWRGFGGREDIEDYMKSSMSSYNIRNGKYVYK